MKTKKTILTLAVGFAFTGFISAQNTEVKVYTQEQINRAASKDASQKETNVKFTEAPAGVVTVQTTTTANTQQANQLSTTAVVQTSTARPIVQAQKAADADARAIERKHETKQVGSGSASNSVAKKQVVESKTTTVQQPVAKKEVHYGPKVTHAPVQKPTTGSNTFIHHPEVSKAKMKTPKSGVK